MPIISPRLSCWRDEPNQQLKHSNWSRRKKMIMNIISMIMNIISSLNHTENHSIKLLKCPNPCDSIFSSPSAWIWLQISKYLISASFYYNWVRVRVRVRLFSRLFDWFQDLHLDWNAHWRTGRKVWRHVNSCEKHKKAKKQKTAFCWKDLILVRN